MLPPVGQQQTRGGEAATPQGHLKLLRWLEAQHVHDLWVCLEAASSYGVDVAQALHDASYPVSVVNPARIAAYAKSRLSRNKTDRAAPCSGF